MNPNLTPRRPSPWSYFGTSENVLDFEKFLAHNKFPIIEKEWDLLACSVKYKFEIDDFRVRQIKSITDYIRDQFGGSFSLRTSCPLEPMTISVEIPYHHCKIKGDEKEMNPESPFSALDYIVRLSDTPGLPDDEIHEYKNTVIKNAVSIPKVCPAIQRIDTYNYRVVKVTFTDGTFTKSVCSQNDYFDLDVGITICLMKKMLGGDNPTKAYNDLIKHAHKVMDDQAAIEMMTSLAIREEKIRQKKLKEKRAARKQRRIDEYKDIHKQAILEAIAESKEAE